MADLLLATNLVPRPLPLVGTTTTPAWLQNNGADAQINGRTPSGNELIGVLMDNSKAAHAPLGAIEAAELSYVIHVSGGHNSFPGTYFVALVLSTGAPVEDETGFVSQHDLGAGKVDGTLTGTLAVPDGAEVFLRVRAGATSRKHHANMHGARVSVDPITDELGIFSGDIADTEEVRYEWLGDPELSASQAWAIGAAPDPEPEPPTGTWGPLVSKHLGRPGDIATEELAESHGAIVLEYVRGYTIGELGEEKVAPGIRAVIISSTARLTSNPEQVSYFQTGDYSERPAILAGWTLPELAILNNFRRRQS